jgi:2-polyprenyl-3-methyl-5-hydroxy-6-metoxy-1,4-benzoquinol methylase
LSATAIYDGLGERNFSAHEAQRENFMSTAISSRLSESHYDSQYFKWQCEIGRFGGWANLTKFSAFVSPEMKVLDFGCGGGFLLSKLECREKLGIEINPAARAEAARLGVAAVASTSEIEDQWADIIISNHALEHCPFPLSELQALLPKLAPGGLSVFVVPCEAIRHKYIPNDRNHHLYTWSPMSAGNLFTEAGFEVIESKAYKHFWPPRFLPQLFRAIGGRWLFDIVCQTYGILTYLNLSPCSVSQVRVVARRPVGSRPTQESPETAHKAITLAC